MTYTLEMNTEGSLLVARVSGKRTLETVSAMAMHIVQACIEQQCTLALVDVRPLEGRLTVSNSYQVVADGFDQYRRMGLQRAAIVDREIDPDGKSFFETVARNRGFDLRIFTDMTEARAWLQA
jgi:hypothetical protein